MSYPYALVTDENKHRPHFYIGHTPKDIVDLQPYPTLPGAHVCANCFNVWTGSAGHRTSIGPCCGYLWDK